MKPNIDRYKEEALKRGLIFIGKSPQQSRKYKYKFNDCSHFIDESPSNLRRHTSKVKCKTCLVDKYTKEAIRRGLLYIGSANDGTFNFYKVARCGTKLKIQPSNVRRTTETYNCTCKKCTVIKVKEAKKNNVRYRVSNPKIKKAIEERRKKKLEAKYQEEANKKGLVYLGKSKHKSKHYRSYQFITCGCIADIQTPVVRHANPYCHLCKEEEFKNDALNVGLSLIGKSTRHKRKYKFISCGHVQSIGMKEVRTNSFICNTCEETSRDKPSKVYILEMKYEKNKWLDLGYAKIIDNRVRNYGVLPGTSYKILSAVDFKTGRKAHKYEISIHKKYLKHKIPKTNMKIFLTKNGYNECYPMEMKETLLTELNRLTT